MVGALAVSLSGNESVEECIYRTCSSGLQFSRVEKGCTLRRYSKQRRHSEID